MKRSRKMLLIAVGAVGLIVLLSLLLPSSFSASGEKEIAARVEIVFKTVLDVTNHPRWNARKARDESMRFTFPGSVRVGKGAVFEWTSKTDTGLCTIVDAVENKSITVRVELSGRGKGGGETLWTFEPKGNHTKVTRAFHGKIDVPLIGPWVVLFARPGKGLTADFDTELQGLKQIVEGGASVR